ncbi:MAG: 30S ribosomal protein S9 [Chitinophagaceae bacterium]|nr:30S ribosomal protein S9 [Chitinophagaceae bacterium]MCB9044713.1 30S ribosomal protein S9 [Chitinophagales bacterium]
MEKRTNTVGRRKEAVARVYLSKGTGNITVNGKEYKNYFTLMYLQNQVERPLLVTETLTGFDITVNVQGGGPKGQAEAIKLGIARALMQENAEQYHDALKKEGMLTRDPRSVERKKFGKRKARRSFQFSKR